MDFKFLRDDGDHLLVHGKAYLKAARLLLFQIIENKYQWSDKNKRVPAEVGEIPYYAEELLPPALFCIQHGIEVSLKSCLEDAEVEYKSNHRTLEHYKKLKKYVLKENWKQITINGWQVLISREEVNRIKTSVFSDLDPLIEYFYYNDILHEKLGRPRAPDHANEIFRYPKSMSGDNYDIEDLASKITDNDVNELINKLDIIFDSLMDIGYLIAETRAQKKNPEAVFENI